MFELIAGVVGLIVPPAFDFVKKKFLGPDQDTPEATLNSLATTKPEIMPAYLEAVVNHLRAKIEWFNRDVVGTPSQWVIDLRASIRPVSVLICAGLLGAEMIWSFDMDAGTRSALVMNMTNWFGGRLVKN